MGRQKNGRWRLLVKVWSDQAGKLAHKRDANRASN